MLSCWIYEPIMSTHEALLFYNALKQHESQFYYIPVAVARREEEGIRYRYHCIARSKLGPAACSHFTGIELYKPILGMPYITYIHNYEADHWRCIY